MNANVDRTVLLKRYEAAGCPFIHYGGSSHLAGEPGARALDSIPDGYLPDIERQLAAHEAQQRSVHVTNANDAARDADLARLRVPLTDDEPEAREVRALAQEAAAIEARQEGFATRGQLDELLGLTREVLTELRARR